MTSLEVSVLGSGPAIVLPVSLVVTGGEDAERLRAWGADPNAGHALATGLVEAGYQVIAADYQGHLERHPQPDDLTADKVASDLLGVADAAGVERFAYYGYSLWAVAGLQVAIRTHRLTALAMGGFPPLGGPYGPMLKVTRAAHRLALTKPDRPVPVDVEPGDWDSADVVQTPEQTRQYVTLYESLRDFDERAALDRVTVPRLAFAGANDNISYGPKWGDAYVGIADGLTANRDDLVKRGWTVHVLPDRDHMSAMHADAVLSVLLPWLKTIELAG